MNAIAGQVAQDIEDEKQASTLKRAMFSGLGRPKQPPVSQAEIEAAMENPELKSAMEAMTRGCPKKVNDWRKFDQACDFLQKIGVQQITTKGSSS